MKIKTISRTSDDFCRKTKHDITKVHRNRDPALHPFERAREYTKAVVATKLDKIFAKPFIGALDGHSDGVYCMSTIRNKNVPFISGSCDGEVKVWDLARRLPVWSTPAHLGFVRGVSPAANGATFFTCGDDKLIKQWALAPTQDSSNPLIAPLNTYISAHPVLGIDHHWVDNQFATCGESVCIWDANRTEPLHTYSWGADSIISCRFNPAEAALVASTGNDRGVCLYDVRAAVPMRKFMLAMNSNKIVWNPMEPMNFLLANEDHNVYSFDMRKLDKALMVHKDHVSAVMDVAFSPTGREFVTGSYDRTLRMFKTTSGRSRDVYHTKRMQRVFCVNYSSDSQFVLSGSDDTNVRVWKADASKALGTLSGRQLRKEQFQDTIKKRFSHMPEVKRITKDQKTPKAIKKAASLKHDSMMSSHRKMENRKQHSSLDTSTMKTEREKSNIKTFV